MKKFILSIVILLGVLGVTYPGYHNNALDKIALNNVEAMADAEVIVGPFCRGNSGICIVYPNGFFILGVRQYF